MTVIPKTKNPVVILNEFLSDLQTQTGITNFEPNTKIRVLVDTLVAELSSYLSEQREVFKSIQKTSATGESLEKIGLDYGRQKALSTRAFALSVERNVAFYVLSGTFGDINSGSDIALPKGTVIYSIENQNDLNKRIDFVLSQDTILDKDESISFVSVEASIVGSVSNVNKNVLKKHNFTNYTLSSQDSLKVNNFFPILNGQDRESEESFRNKLLTYFDSLFAANKTGLQLAALKPPGVKNVSVQGSHFGIGRGAVFIQGTERETNQKMLISTQTELNALRPPGLSYTALPAIELGVDIVLKAEGSKALTALQKNEISALSRGAISLYLKDKPMGSSISKRDILAEIAKVFSARSLSTRTLTIKSLTYQKSYGSNVSIVKETLLSDILVLDPNEYTKLNSLEIEFV